MKNNCCRWLGRLGTLFLLPFACTFYGQTITGSISGRVVDAQTAAVQGATVTITEPDTHFSAITKTGAEGGFLSAGLLPGNYAITVEVPGFKKLTRAGVTLDANDKLDIGDLKLEVGNVTESVEVSGEAALLQTESVERSATISGRQIENIEVNGRNPLDLAKLVPGVLSTANFSLSGITGLGNLNVNGNRGSQNQLTVNGISAVDTGNNGQQNVVLSMDSIAEFKILTGTYQAEYGRSVGGQISLVTKSGSDQFHGSGYWYHRNEGLNANTFLNNVRNLPKPLFRYNDPGYTIGGPVLFPGKLKSLNHKLYFFWSEEFQRQLAPNTPKNVLVPTALERKGDFSQSLDNTGKKLTFINDPISQTPFPGLVVPASRIYAPGQALLNLFPLPNAPQVSNFNYTSQLPGKQPRREDLLRIDYNVNDRLHIFGHYIQDAQPTVTPYGSFVLGLNLPLASISNPQPGRGAAGGATYVFSPTLTNEFNFGYSQNQLIISEATNVLRRGTSGINLPVLYPNSVQGDYIPNISFNGTRITASPSLGTADAPFHAFDNTMDLSDSLTKVWGRHRIKTGIFTQRSSKDQSSFASYNGSYNFGDNPSNPYDTGFGFSNALLGVYNTFSQAANYIDGRYHYWNVEGFVQDTWKITNNLTLDYGLRVAYYEPQYDIRQQEATFVPSMWDPAKAPRLYQPVVGPTGARQAYDPATNTYLPSFNIGLEVPGSGDPYNGVCLAGTCVSKYLTKNRGPQWGPRFGVAWDVTGNGNLVIRTGAGIYYDRVQGNRTFDFVGNPPKALTPTLQQNLVSTISPNNVLIGPPSIAMADPTGVLPTTYQYQLGVQYRLPFDMALDAAYVGTQARHLQDNRNINYNAFGQCYLPQNQDPQRLAASPTSLLGNNCKDANFLKPYIGFGNITVYEGASNSNYNALQVSLQRRATKGLFIGLAYTWSKSLGIAGNGLASTNDNASVRPDQYTRQAYYGPTNFDRRQVLAVNYVYTLPRLRWGNGVTRAFTDGWQWSGVTQGVSGSPLTPGFSIQGAGNQNITGSNTEGARIGVVAGCNPHTGSSDPFNRLNPACFYPPLPGSKGLESGINFVYGPSVVDFDMALQKEVRVRERVRFQFRVDAFNVFNHAIFTGYNSSLAFAAYPQSGGIVTGSPALTATALGRNPNGTLNVTGFGTVTQAAPGALGYARILQTLIRIQF